MELPISLELAKAHLRVGDSSHDDELIAAKLEMAFSIAEDMTNRDIRTEYTAETIPGAVVQAILLILGTYYNNEADVVNGVSVTSLPLGAADLLRPWRIHPY